MMLYAHKKFLVTVNRVEEDGELFTIHGKEPVTAGNFIAHDQLGDPMILTEEYFYENYIPVREMKKSRQRVKSPFENEYEKQLLEFGCLGSQFEDESYINGQKNMLANKAF